MLVLKRDPVGIDFIIDRIQKKVDTYLAGRGWDSYMSYHRAYKNPKSGNTIPEIYTGDGEYLEVLFDDTYNATSFFLVEDSSSKDEEFIITQGVSMIFQVQLNKIFKDISHRADQELHADLLSAVASAGFEKYIDGVTTGVNNVYSELSISGDLSELVLLDDMSNYHVVKIDLELNYQFDNCGTRLH